MITDSDRDLADSVIAVWDGITDPELAKPAVRSAILLALSTAREEEKAKIKEK